MSIYYILFPPDYWKLPDKDLEPLATECHIPAYSTIGLQGEEYSFVDRERVIRALVERDASLKVRVNNLLSIGAFIISVVSLVWAIVKR